MTDCESHRLYPRRRRRHLFHNLARSAAACALMLDHLLVWVNGRRHEVRGREAFLSLSDYLRRVCGLTGTKIVCSEGDCGACSVLIGRAAADGSRLVYRPVDSCIQFLFQLDGTHIVTVEGLGGEDRSERCAAGHDRVSRLAVRFLHARFCRRDDWPVGGLRRIGRVGHALRADGQLVPLHGLHIDHRCRPANRCHAAPSRGRACIRASTC